MRLTGGRSLTTGDRFVAEAIARSVVREATKALANERESR
jgi:hypothetical protein